VFAAGEMRALWRACVEENAPCSCQASFRECPIWAEIGKEAFGGWDAVDAHAELRLQQRVLRRPRAVRYRLRPAASDPDFRHFAEGRRALFRAIRRVTGASVIVDSSKDPVYALALSRVRGLDVTALQVIRDSRAYVNTFVNPRAGVQPGGEMMRFYERLGGSASSVARRWLKQHLLSEAAWAFRGRRLRARYEDFTGDPVASRAAILGALGHAVAAGEPTEVAFAAQHVGAGNRLRLRPGAMTLQRDERWKEQLGRRGRVVAAAWTWPFLLAYGYLGPRHRR
jgi:hypothetical protein